MLDLRALFDEIRIPWKDRGRNCSREHVNVCCPFCKDDQGFHLTIREQNGLYYCYRQPRGHSGQHLERVIQALGQRRGEAVRLVNKHRGIAPKTEEHLAGTTSDAREKWDAFDPIEGPYIDYLVHRGCPRGALTGTDLRYKRAGKWSRRVLFPLYGRRLQLLGWTGRAISKSMELRYRAETFDHKGLFYTPYPGTHIRTALVVEGPFDALKAGAVLRAERAGAFALTGKQLNDQRLLSLRDAITAARAERVLLVLDNDAGAHEAVAMRAELSAALGLPVLRRSLPDDYKDFGETPPEIIQEWFASS